MPDASPLVDDPGASHPRPRGPDRGLHGRPAKGASAGAVVGARGAGGGSLRHGPVAGAPGAGTRGIPPLHVDQADACHCPFRCGRARARVGEEMGNHRAGFMSSVTRRRFAGRHDRPRAAANESRESRMSRSGGEGAIADGASTGAAGERGSVQSRHLHRGTSFGARCDCGDHRAPLASTMQVDFVARPTTSVTAPPTRPEV